MVQNELRQYARAAGLSEHRGMVYGEMDGYTVTLAQGSVTSLFSGTPSGAFNIWVSVHFPRQDGYQSLMTRIKDDGKGYRVLDQFRYPHGIRINLGCSFAKFRAFVSWLMSLLPEYGGQPLPKCPICGQSYTGQEDMAYARMQGMAVSAHSRCIDRVNAGRAEERTLRDNKRIGRGILGALLGGLLGCLPWIISYLFGFFVWIFGLVVGLGVSVGYGMAGGRPCRAKYVIIPICVIVCAAVAFFTCMAASVAVDIAVESAQGGLWVNLAARLRSAQFRETDLQQGGVGLLCALVGCTYLVNEMRQEVLGAGEDIRLP